MKGLWMILLYYYIIIFSFNPKSSSTYHSLPFPVQSAAWLLDFLSCCLGGLCAVLALLCFLWQLKALATWPPPYLCPCS